MKLYNGEKLLNSSKNVQISVCIRIPLAGFQRLLFAKILATPLRNSIITCTDSLCLTDRSINIYASHDQRTNSAFIQKGKCIKKTRAIRKWSKQLLTWRIKKSKGKMFIIKAKIQKRNFQIFQTNPSFDWLFVNIRPHSSSDCTAPTDWKQLKRSKQLAKVPLLNGLRMLNLFPPTWKCE